MLPLEHLDRIQITFDDHRLVNNAGLILPATHALRLGHATGRANTGDKLLTLVASALAGGDCTGDTDALRTGGTACTLGGTVKAPSTLGTFLRSSVGPCPSTGPGEPRAAGPGLAGRGGTRRRAPDH